MVKKKCPLCEERLPIEDFLYWGNSGPVFGEQKAPIRWLCHPCHKFYVNVRREFKKDHGRYPTMAEVRKDFKGGDNGEGNAKIT